MNIKVRKRTGNIDIQKELRKTEKHPLFNVTLVSDETINMSGRSSIRKNRFERKTYALKRPVLKTLFFIGMMCFIGGCLSITIAFFKTPVNADNSICNSDKCEARVQRIVECAKYTHNEQDKIQCVLWRTIFSRETPVNRHEKEVIKEEIQELNEIITGDIEPDYDLDRLARAVAMHETSDCTKGSAKYNNCFGIMKWDKQGNRSFKRYATKEDSYKDFKRIWSTHYKKFPTYALAKKYSGNDRTQVWLDNVTHFYLSLQ